MTIARKIHCPSCQVGLKIPATISAGKRIRCPKCTQVFSVPSADGPPPARRPIASEPKAPIAENDEVREPRKERLPAKKTAKKKVARRKQNLALPLVGGGAVLLLGAGVILAVVRPWEARKAVASTGPPGSSLNPGSVSEPSPAKEDSSAPAQKLELASAGKGVSVEGVLPTPDGKGASESERFGAGRRIYESLDCSRCHTLGGSSGGGQRKGRGPDLPRVGADPAHTADWLSQQIRNPRSHRPGSRMPGYEGKVNAEDLRKVAEYLASLK
jgi:mono/diheme cytochrome c family protein